MKKILFLISVSSMLFGFNEPFNYDPFIQNMPLQVKENTLKTTHQNKPKPLTVSSVFENRAFIDGHWYEKGEFVRGYEIIKIKPDYIKLKYDFKTQVLPVGGDRKKILTIKDVK